MFSLNKSSPSLILSIIFLINFIQLTFCQIIYEPGWKIPVPGKPTDRTLNLVGDVNLYEIQVLNYDGIHPSDAQCETQFSPGNYSGPCLTNIAKHVQELKVLCLQSDAYAVVTFFMDGGKFDHEAQVITRGTTWGGFTNEKKGTPLGKSGADPLIGVGDQIGAIVSCIDDNRGPYGI